MCGLSKKSGSPVIVMIYVDDLLVGSISLKGISDVRDALQETLKVKTTGTLKTSKGPGGTIFDQPDRATFCCVYHQTI